MKQDQTTPHPDVPGVLAPPPALAGGLLVVGWLMDWLTGWHLAVNSGPGLVLGLIVTSMGGLLVLACIKALRAARTPVEPWKPTTALVLVGPYGYCRNPIYIGLLLVYIGCAIMSGSGSAFLLLPVLIGLLHVGVILREEAYLTAKFGDTYRDYCRHVPRWLPKGDA